MSRDPLAVLRERIDDAHGLLSCVHCGFCLPACPTYARLGDEADSPRGRLHLMRAVAEGRLDPGSDAYQTHLDRCLGCRACEPVCPSGVPYGHLLEEARAVAVTARRPGRLPRLLLRVFGSRRGSGLAGMLGRLARSTPFPRWMARRGPGRTVRMASAMLDATRERWRERVGPATPGPGAADGGAGEGVGSGPDSASDAGWTPPVEGGHRLVVLDGCVQRGLFSRVTAAARRVLDANGYDVEAWPGAGCCGALHAHAGSLEEARALARRNIAAFERTDAGGVAVDAAGCGAAMRDYGSLLRDDPEWADRAAAFSSKVRDVSEWLVERGPRPGARMPLTVAWDPPCHLLHAQSVDGSVERVLDAIPGLERRPVQRAAECCGGAGIYSLTHPELGDHVGGDKVDAIRASGASVCTTANPGCMMQIGAGLLLDGSDMPVAHPVELLDESYRRAGYYGAGGPR